MTEHRVIVREKHLFTSDEKLAWFGYGEWVEEVDFVVFEYKGYLCRVNRVKVTEYYSSHNMQFGGHLCAWIRLPTDHLYINTNVKDMDIIGYGISHKNADLEYRQWIEFDCAKNGDYVPSSVHKEKTKLMLQGIQEETGDDTEIKIMMDTIYSGRSVYRNVEYVMKQCEEIVDQLIGIQHRMWS